VPPDLLHILDAEEVAAEEEVTQVSAKPGHATEDVEAATGTAAEVDGAGQAEVWDEFCDGHEAILRHPHCWVSGTVGPSEVLSSTGSLAGEWSEQQGVNGMVAGSRNARGLSAVQVLRANTSTLAGDDVPGKDADLSSARLSPAEGLGAARSRSTEENRSPVGLRRTVAAV